MTILEVVSVVELRPALTTVRLNEYVAPGVKLSNLWVWVPVTLTAGGQTPSVDMHSTITYSLPPSVSAVHSTRIPATVLLTVWFWTGLGAKWIFGHINVLTHNQQKHTEHEGINGEHKYVSILIWPTTTSIDSSLEFPTPQNWAAHYQISAITCSVRKLEQLLLKGCGENESSGRISNSRSMKRVIGRLRNISSSGKGKRSGYTCMWTIMEEKWAAGWWLNRVTVEEAVVVRTWWLQINYYYKTIHHIHVAMYWSLPAEYKHNLICSHGGG